MISPSPREWSFKTQFVDSRQTDVTNTTFIRPITSACFLLFNDLISNVQGKLKVTTFPSWDTIVSDLMTLNQTPAYAAGTIWAQGQCVARCVFTFKLTLEPNWAYTVWWQKPICVKDLAVGHTTVECGRDWNWTHDRRLQVDAGHNHYTTETLLTQRQLTN